MADSANSEARRKAYFFKRHPILTLSCALVCVFVSYLFFRSPANRYADFLRLSETWKYYCLRATEFPRSLEVRLLAVSLLPTGPVEAELPGGIRMELDPQDLVDRAVLRRGEWEPVEWSWIATALRTGDVFVDVGAHHGTYTVKAARVVGDTGRVIAVEPNPASVERLRKNIALNGLSNVTVVEAACGDRKTVATLFFASGRNTGMTSLSAETAKRSGPAGGSAGREVRVEPLDEILVPYSGRRISVIKVDTEGAETMVLRGAMATIRTHRPAVVVETVDSQLKSLGSSLDELESVLQSYGCRKTQSTRSNAMWLCGQP